MTTMEDFDINRLLEHPVMGWVSLILFLISLLDKIFKLRRWSRLYKNSPSVKSKTNQTVRDVSFIIISTIINVGIPVWVLTALPIVHIAWLDLLICLLAISFILGNILFWALLIWTKRELDSIGIVKSTNSV